MSICGTDSYCYLSGTSCAAPLVAGAAALVFQKAKTQMRASEVKTVLINTVSKISCLGGKVSSGGYLNLSEALVSIK